MKTFIKCSQKAFRERAKLSNGYKIAIVEKQSDYVIGADGGAIRLLDNGILSVEDVLSRMFINKYNPKCKLDKVFIGDDGDHLLLYEGVADINKMLVYVRMV